MKIILSGGWSYGNIGDEAIAKSMMYLVNKTFEYSEMIITSYDPSDFMYHHNVETIKSVHRMLNEQNISDISKLDIVISAPVDYNLGEYEKLFDEDTVFIMGGGGYFVGTWDSMLLSRLVEIHIAKQKGAKVLLLGQSIGPIMNKDRGIVKRALNLCDYICVRDIASKQLIDEIMGKETADVAADVAVHISDIVSKEAYTDHKKHMCMMLQYFTYHVDVNSASRFHGNNVGKVLKRVLGTKYIYDRKIKKIICEMAKREDIHFDFVLSVQKTGMISNSHFLDYAEKMAANLPKDRYTIHTDLNIDEFCKKLSGGRATLSVKMHPLVVSSSYKVDTIAITQNYKIDDYMDALGRTDYCYKNTKINTNKIIEQLNKSFDRDTDEGINNIEKLKSEVLRMFNSAREMVMK